jgi:hypothetical protein
MPILTDAFHECEDITLTGVVVGDQNVRLCVGFRLDLPREGWNKFAEIADR